MSKLSKAHKGFKPELAHLNSELLDQGRELDLACEELTTLQRHNQELLQQLASSLE